VVQLEGADHINGRIRLIDDVETTMQKCAVSDLPAGHVDACRDCDPCIHAMMVAVIMDTTGADKIPAHRERRWIDEKRAEEMARRP